jgi:hypothetical protein
VGSEVFEDESTGGKRDGLAGHGSICYQMTVLAHELGHCSGGWSCYTVEEQSNRPLGSKDLKM